MLSPKLLPKTLLQDSPFWNHRIYIISEQITVNDALDKMLKRLATSPRGLQPPKKKARDNNARPHITSTIETRTGVTPHPEAFHGKRLVVYRMLLAEADNVDNEPHRKPEMLRIKLRIAASIGMLSIMDDAKLEALSVPHATSFTDTIGFVAENVLDRCK